MLPHWPMTTVTTSALAARRASPHADNGARQTGSGWFQADVRRSEVVPVVPPVRAAAARMLDVAAVEATSAEYGLVWCAMAGAWRAGVGWLAGWLAGGLAGR